MAALPHGSIPDNPNQPRPDSGQFASPLEAALAYHRARYNVLPIKRDGSKHPSAGGWKQWQTQRQTEQWVRRQWGNPTAPLGVALVCGTVSGGLEVIDFDRNADDVFPQWCELVEWERPGLTARLSLVKTPGGFHAWLRCSGVAIPGNMKLASDPNFTGGQTTVVETRGTGGYALVPGCPPECHRTGRLYLPHGGVALIDLQPISPEEREVIIRAARCFDQTKRPLPVPHRPQASLTPLDDFDRNGPDWSELLEPVDWVCVLARNGVRYWKRPGRDGPGWSATTGHCRGKNGEELFRVFSSNAEPFAADQSYGKARAFAVLHHKGNLSAACAWLARKGYGPALKTAAASSPASSPARAAASSPATSSADSSTSSPASIESNGVAGPIGGATSSPAYSSPAIASNGQDRSTQTKEQAIPRPSPATTPLAKASPPCQVNPPGPEPSAATRLVALVQSEAEPFLDEAGRPWLRYQSNQRWEVSPLPSEGVTVFVRGLVRKHEKRVVNSDTLRSSIEELAAIALEERKRHKVAVRVAEYGDKVYLDLADDERRVVEVSADGWRVVTDCPIRFRRAQAMLPLPVPSPGRSLNELCLFLNIKNEADFVLLKAWLVNALWPIGVKAHLILTGPAGTAKSTTARFLASLIDPNAFGLRTQPRDVQSLAIATTQQWLLPFDNLSTMPTALSDALCSLSTGGAFGGRALYTDDEEKVFFAIRPVILTSIAEIATAGDLLSRCVSLELSAIDPERRREEEELKEDWARARPELLAALLDVLASTMAGLPFVRLAERPRMADFARLAVAAGPAAGYSDEEFLDAYRGNELASHQLALEEGPLYPALRQHFDRVGGNWSGSATELLDALDQLVGEEGRARRGWPKNPTSLSNRLKQLDGALRAAGIVVERERSAAKDRQRRIVIRPAPPPKT